MEEYYYYFWIINKVSHVAQARPGLLNTILFLAIVYFSHHFEDDNGGCFDSSLWKSCSNNTKYGHLIQTSKTLAPPLERDAAMC